MIPSSSRLVPLALLLCLAAGCSAAGGGRPPEAMPADFAVRYEWGNGALPPPYHYDYTIRVGPGAGTGRVEFRPGYDSIPVWTESFPVSEAQLRSLYATFRERGVFDRAWKEGVPMVGGTMEWLEATAAGRSVTLPSQPDEVERGELRRVYAAVVALVPEGVIAGLVARQERFQQEQEASGGSADSVPPPSSPDTVP